MNILEKSFLTDIIGKDIGDLKILDFDPERSYDRHYFYKCQCKKCGNIFSKIRQDILNGICLQCFDCYKKEQTELAARKIIGQRFGRLTVLDIDHIDTKVIERKNRKNPVNASIFYYKCQCDCGNICVVEKHHLGKNTFSCGCLNRERRLEANKTHNMSKTRFYRIWQKMINRCTKLDDPSYQSYGARGIVVCDRWKMFENFRDDMYDSYKQHVEEFGEKDTSIERINVDGNYEPNNCTWATRVEQNRNKRDNIRLNYNSNEYVAMELYQNSKAEICSRTFYQRLQKNGYKSGDSINVYDERNNIFEGSKIIRPIEFSNHIICPIEPINKCEDNKY